jgi:hypothetical protein
MGDRIFLGEAVDGIVIGRSAVMPSTVQGGGKRRAGMNAATSITFKILDRCASIIRLI